MYTNLLIVTAQPVAARVIGEVVIVLLGIPSTADDASQVDFLGAEATGCHVEVLTDRVTIAAKATMHSLFQYKAGPCVHRLFLFVIQLAS